MSARLEVLKKALVDQNTFASVLLVIAVDRLELEMLQWDPETIRMELDQTFEIKMPDPCFNKLMAAVTIVTSDAFYKDLPTFIALCNALCDGSVETDQWEPADALEIAWGIVESMLVWPPQGKDPFVPQILEYIAAALKDEGIMDPPDVLKLGMLAGSKEWKQVQDTFSEDPEMFAAIYETEQAKTAEINNIVKQRLTLLFEQLQALELGTGIVGKAVKGVAEALRAAGKDDPKEDTAQI